MSEIKIPTKLCTPHFRFILLKQKEKIPFESGWSTTANYKHDDKKLQEHLKTGGNYGVVGGYGDLVIIDADVKEIEKAVEDNLPETLTVKTGRFAGGKHYYYLCPGLDKPVRLKEDGNNNLGDVQWTGKQVVGPSSVHPNGNTYNVVKDINIATITPMEIDLALNDFLIHDHIVNDEKIAREHNVDIDSLKISELINIGGFQQKGDEYQGSHPVHGSDGGKNLSVNPSRNIWRCFRCKSGGGPLSWIAVQEGIIECKEAKKKALQGETFKRVLKIAREKYGLKKEIKIEGQTFERIKLPASSMSRSERTIGEFAEELGVVVARREEIFFKTALKCAVEIRKFKTNEEEEYLGFSELQGGRFVTLAEKMAYLYKSVFTATPGGGGVWEDIKKNMSVNVSNLTIMSEQFLNKLKQIKRIFPIPIPIIHDGKMTFPKERYDARFQSWVDPSNVKLAELPVDEAKQIIHNIFDEFCFERDEEGKLSDSGNQSRTHAIAGLITPFLRGLYSSFNIRTPLFFYLGNRPRVGKDYCAAMTGLLYEGVAIEEPPLSTGKKEHSTNDELRKKIMSVILRGRRRLHFSNNKGRINCAMLENIITSKTFADRLLGGNEVATFDNELEFSMSGNLGVSFTPDLANRSRFVNLFLAIEDPNARVFERPDLHKWVLDNRSMILSAIYTLVKSWYDAGAPKGETPFTSFHEWAEICGGIMKYHGFGDPCLPDRSEVVTDCDEETMNMKKLFELLYEEFADDPFMKKDIFRLLADGWQEQYNLFGWVKLDDSGKRASFSKKFKQNVNRIYSGITLKLHTKANRASLDKYLLQCVGVNQQELKMGGENEKV